ncbi:Segregation and condensation protein B [Limihaloglobus sulfuriphilus]|uniref:Segregation and condensation protein B n=1 Tax=Limihaloglobus sulfuriphilus TaxID=1851148 RepID=A0A1R7T682_9BACT|nr:SMC-Scp complex subunit ScpB [Limihaloglobus sulfuriphilus]AQQ72476.1 Segregation and condensation protein B [Limihaloglobus sulfuriphilus]
MQEEPKGYEKDKASESEDSQIAAQDSPESRNEQIEDLNIPAREVDSDENEVLADNEAQTDSSDDCRIESELSIADQGSEDSLDGAPAEDSDENQQEGPASEVRPWSHGLDEDFGENDYPRPEIASVVEAILFASDEPVTLQKLMSVADISIANDVRAAVEMLNERYENCNSAFRIEKIAGGYQMLTHPVYKHWLLKLVNVRSETKLTQAALETLAIVAYKQPIIRADVEAIRGVSSGEMIRSLMTKGLVKITGRAEVVGRPMLYGTTKKFLEVFGLSSIKDLPKVEDLKNPGT